MRVQVHDVDHGSCVTVTGPTGDVLMLDCGRSLARPWSPATYGARVIQTLIFQNLDEDHVEGLPGLCLPGAPEVRGIYSNPTVTAPALAVMKAGGMGTGVRHAHEVLRVYGAGGIGAWQHDLGGVHWQAFHNQYPWHFTDTNNLSVAVFVRWGDFTILLGGDMECAGWEQLLKNPAFVARLAEVKVYVASHHGRENGQCAALFRFMRPDIVIFSDCEKRHGTQETRDWYAGRVNGVRDTGKKWTATGPVMRKVMTTRSDGTLDIRVNASGGYTIYYEKSEPTIEEIIAALIPPASPVNRLLSGFP